MSTAHPLFALLLCVAFGWPQGPEKPATASAPAEIIPPKGPITPEELRDLEYRLASDEFEGRLSGGASGRKAGDFVADQLKARGVEPYGDGGGYFQPFEHADRGGRGGGDQAGPGSYRNIVGIVKGADPKLRDEYVIVGAHYDHCGKGEQGAGGGGNLGEIHHGADDNGSGTTTVLALARVVAAKPLPRSTVFILFDAEERGLWGSEHFSNKPLVPLDKVQIMVNIDMVGRSYDGYLFVSGMGTANQLDDILTKALKNETRFLKKVERNPDSDDRSDQFNFSKKKIPVLFFFTGVHRDYHQPRDTPDKIQYKPMAAIARCALEVMKICSAMKERLDFKTVGMNGMPKGDAAVEALCSSRARALCRRLGGQIHPNPEGQPTFADTEAAGVRAGISKGDVVLAIAKAGTKNPKDFKEVKTVEELRVETEKFKPGDGVQLRIFRDGKPLVISTTIGDVPEWKYGPDKEAGDLPFPKGKP